MAPPSEVSGDFASFAGDWQEGLLQRQMVEMHEKLEARLVSALEVHHASLLQALSRNARSGPWRLDQDCTRPKSSAPTTAPQGVGCAEDTCNQDAGPNASDWEGTSPSRLNVNDDNSPTIAGVGVRQNVEEKEEDEEEEDEDVAGETINGNLDAAHDHLRTKRTLVITESSRGLAFHGFRHDVPNQSANCIHRVRMFVAWLLKRRECELFISFIILANAISLGVSTDWSIKNPTSKVPMYFWVLDYFFLCAFSVELLLRLLADGFQFFNPHNPTFSWNMFDGFLVGVTILNEGTFGINLSVVRAFRILRLVSMIRAIRLMSGFRELRMMVAGIMNCGRTLLWSILLLTVIAYMYSVFCLQFSAEWLASKAANGGSHEGCKGSAHAETCSEDSVFSTTVFLDKHFSSLPRSMYTLSKAAFGGINWGEVSDVLEHVNALMFLTFPFYIVISVFVVLNIITAAFVEAAARTSQEEDTNALEHIEERQQWIGKIRSLFLKHDTDHDSTLNWEEFQTVMNDWRTQQYFHDEGLSFDFQRAKNMFRLFDWDGDGTIDVDEFAQGVHHLKGNARSLDMFREFQCLNRKVDKNARKWERALAQIRSGASRQSNTASVASMASTNPSAGADFLNDEPHIRAGPPPWTEARRDGFCERASTDVRLGRAPTSPTQAGTSGG